MPQLQLQTALLWFFRLLKEALQMPDYDFDEIGEKICRDLRLLCRHDLVKRAGTRNEATYELTKTGRMMVADTDRLAVTHDCSSTYADWKDALGRIVTRVMAPNSSMALLWPSSVYFY
jgi:hypothetical protein